MIELKGLTKRYGELQAVRGLNLMIPDGEIFGFIGPNGAGKTTTIRMMGGVLAPTEGTVWIDGINMARDPASAKGRIGFIPDRPYLYEKLTGMEFMKFSADLYGVNPVEFPQKAERLLEQFSLDGWSEELIEAYSHGMKQRLIFSAALLHEPSVVIVDEPMVGLDPAGIRLVKEILRNLADGGTSVFMSTHTLEIADEICDRIGIIQKGSLIAEGTTNELKRMSRSQKADLEEIFLSLTEGRNIS